jgi:hypothetical protein
MPILSFIGQVIYFANALQKGNGGRLQIVVNLPVGVSLPELIHRVLRYYLDPNSRFLPASLLLQFRHSSGEQ